MGKLGMAAVAGGTIASIFSSCKKINIEDNHTAENQISIELQDKLNEIKLKLLDIENKLSLPGLTEEQVEAYYQDNLRTLDQAAALLEWGISQGISDETFDLYSISKESFSNDVGKLKEFAQWHTETSTHAIRIEDYTPSRAAYFVTTDKQAKEWYDTHFLKYVG